eukprot:TRINITY_DN2994_c0_g1_i1.p1 TRINITY_DN2994_c0_g1~~TRINITY_DN2994_c0_g1_i1.p1  ORF type:complete len:178 (+),score=41.26 TRINITY_DN2994_c0_g1_i1:53-535(+)
MHYASSRQPVKDTLGATAFTDDCFASLLKEFTLKSYRHSREVLPAIDVRSGEEIMKEEVEKETQPVGTQTAVLQQLTVSYDDGMKALLEQYKGSEVDTILMTLDPKDQKIAGEKGPDGFSDLVGSLSKSGPCFILHRYEHEDKDGKEHNGKHFYYFSTDK